MLCWFVNNHYDREETGTQSQNTGGLFTIPTQAGHSLYLFHTWQLPLHTVRRKSPILNMARVLCIGVPLQMSTKILWWLTDIALTNIASQPDIPYKRFSPRYHSVIIRSLRSVSTDFFEETPFSQYRTFLRVVSVKSSLTRIINLPLSQASQLA